jgi:hypothetical protein
MNHLSPAASIPARRTMLAIAAALAACIAMLASSASPASAAASCTAGPTKTHDGRTFHTRICPNYAGVGVYSIYTSGKLGPRLDTMRSTSSWFACQQRFASTPNPTLGSGHNHYWLWTAGDDHGTWGWFPANAIKIGGQEAAIPGVPLCSAA